MTQKYSKDAIERMLEPIKGMLGKKDYFFVYQGERVNQEYNIMRNTVVVSVYVWGRFNYPLTVKVDADTLEIVKERNMPKSTDRKVDRKAMEIYLAIRNCLAA